jgi:hypothetical protein
MDPNGGVDGNVVRVAVGPRAAKARPRTDRVKKRIAEFRFDVLLREQHAVKYFR